MRLQTLFASALSAAFAASATVAGAQTAYTITELPAAGCNVTSINDSGSVTGQCNNVATAWQGGTAASLGTLPGGGYSYASSINATGSVVGEGDLGDGRPHALLFRNGAVINIDPSAPNSHSVYVNDAGVIVGNALKGFGTCNSWIASIYVEDAAKPGTFRRTDLQPAPGGDGKVRCEYATGANRGLQVVGMMQNSTFGHRGAFWNNDGKHTLTLLQPFGTDAFSNAWAINDVGQAAGDSQGDPVIVNRPVMWEADASHTPINLPLLAGDNYGTTTAINARGEVVGWSALATLTPNVGYILSASRPVVWSGGAVTTLQSLIDPAGGWTITTVYGINDNGEILAAGLHNGQSSVFVMTPSR